MSDSIRRICPICNKKPISRVSACCRQCAPHYTPNALPVIRQKRDTFTPGQSNPNKPLRKSAVSLKRYGLTLQDYEVMQAKQNYVCAICGNPPDMNDFLVVDHCHDSGVVRELLCRKCNLMIGHAKDNIETLSKAIDYLKKYTT